MSVSDYELLQDYARNGSQSAFALLVHRHLNLVYSAARRQVRSSQLAEEIAQSVFIDLSRCAARITSSTPVVAWLHLVTRRTAIDTIRKESRRQMREQMAFDITAMKPGPSVWTQMEPMLDEALESLKETDRTALLLRYFEDKSLREVSLILRTSEGAAQKRVTRAIEQLRIHFARRGVAMTTAGLTTELCAHAIQIAPVALGSAIVASAPTLIATGIQAAAFEVTKNVAMTSIQKSALGAVIALALGGGFYEASVSARQQSEISGFRRRVSDLTSTLRNSQVENANAASRLRSVEAQIDSRMAWAAARLSSGDAALEAQMKSWLANLDRIKSFLQQRPDQTIPEMRLLSEEVWLTAASEAHLETEEGVRRALARLRQTAENLMLNKVKNAMSAYLLKNDGALPSHITQLLPYLEAPLEPAWLDRYEILESSQSGERDSRKQRNIIAVKRPVDVEYDTYWRVGLDGGSAVNAMSYNISYAQKAFSESNAGKRATSAVALMPYLKWPVSEAVVQNSLSPRSASTAP